MQTFSVIVPTYRPGRQWVQWLEAFKRQSLRPQRAILIDSSSNDGTAELAHSYGFEVHVIPVEEFNHGRTRQFGVALANEVEVVLFLTQDAVLAEPDSLQKLLEAFGDARVGAAYGRQLPQKDATPIAAHARLFNYPPVSRVKSFEDTRELGVKTLFISNSFAAYRCIALREVRGFPSNAIVSEDQAVSARMLVQGWKIAYAAEAKVYHSHNYTMLQEFRRYFDIGTFYAQESWIQEKFGGAEGEGARFVRSEIAYLWREAPALIPVAILRSALKFFAYRLQRMNSLLPMSLTKRISMNPHYWEEHPSSVKRTP